MRSHKAEVAELVDAADSKSAGSNVLGVQVPPSVPFLTILSFKINTLKMTKNPKKELLGTLPWYTLHVLWVIYLQKPQWNLLFSVHNPEEIP